MIALRFRTFLSYFLAFIVLFFILYRSLYFAPNLFESGASLVLYPVIKMQHIVVKPLQKFFKKRKKIDALYQQIAILQEHNDALEAENIELNARQTYQENTLELINFKERYGVCDAHLAQVILKQFSDYEQSFLVDCGAVHGITVDMVAVHKNCLVGRVTHVYPYYSKVVLITDSDCKIAAYCRSSKARGIHEGCNKKKNTLLQFVSHLHQLKENDLIVSSGEGLIFPQGFGLGRLHLFESDGLHYKIVVKPLLKLNTLDYCYLIKKSQTVS